MRSTSLATGRGTDWVNIQISSYTHHLLLFFFGSRCNQVIFFCFLCLLFFHWYSLSGGFILHSLIMLQSLLEVKFQQRALLLINKVNSEYQMHRRISPSLLLASTHQGCSPVGTEVQGWGVLTGVREPYTSSAGGRRYIPKLFPASTLVDEGYLGEKKEYLVLWD